MSLAAFAGFAQGLGSGMEMKQRRKNKLADDARQDAMLAVYERQAMGLPGAQGGGAGAGAGGSRGGGGTPSGTWTPAAPGPKLTDLPFNGQNGPLAFDGKAPNQPQGGPQLGFGSATMTPQEMLIEGAKRRGLDPIDVATAISYETGGRFDPTIKGPTTQWGTHEGLIQFGDPQAELHGAVFDQGPDVAWRSQLDPNNGAVWSYLDSVGVKPGMGLDQIYSGINAGGVNRMGASDANNGGAPGTVADKVAGMDPHRQKAAAFLGGTWTPNGAEAATVAVTRAQLRAEYPVFRDIPDAELDAAIVANGKKKLPPRGRGI